MEPMGIKEILDTIPHRYPFLLIDKVLEMKEGESIKAIKNVTMNEPFFQGHYPGNPIMPGVLIIEAMAQAASFLGIKTLGNEDGKKVPLFAGIDKARFKKPVGPGDVITFDLEVVKKRSAIWWVAGTAKVDGALVCKAELQAAFATVE